MARAGAAWVDVLPNLSLFNRLVNEGIRVPLSAAGTKAGKEYGSALRTSTKQSTAGIGALVAAEMQRGAAEAASTVDAAAGKVAAARKREADAAGRLRVAESKLAESRAKGNASASSLITAEERVAAAQRGVETAAAGAVGATKSLERAQAAAATQADVSSKRMVESTGKMSLLGGAAGKAHSAVRGLGGAFVGMLGITAAFEIGKFAKEAVTSAGDFQKSMNLLVTAGGESGKAIGLVASGIKTIAVETGTSTSQLAEGIYTVEKASFRGADGLKVLRAAAQAAADEQVGLGVMTNGLTSIMRSYGIPASGVVSVTNELVAASGRAKSTMTDFAGSLSTVLPIASAAHISFAQVAGAVATLTSHGTSAQEATQHLAFTIRALQAPNMQAQKMMTNFGISALDVSRNLGKRGLSGTLDLISESILKRMGPAGITMLKTFNQSKDAGKNATTMFKQLSPEAKKLAEEFIAGGSSAGQFGVSVGKTLGGMDSVLAKSWLTAYSRSKGFNDVLKSGTSTSKTYQGALTKIMGGAAGLNTALQLTGGSASYLKESIKEIGDAGQKTGKDISVWAQTQKTFNIQLARFREGAQVAGINLGTKLLPPLTTLLRNAIALPGWLHKNSAALKGWAFGIGLVAASFAVLDLMHTVSEVESVSGAIVKAATSTKVWAAATRVLAIASNASWIGILVVAIAALVAGFIYAFKHSKRFHDGVMAALHGVAAAGQWMWEKALKPAFAGLKVAFFAVGDAAVWLWNKGIKPAFAAITSAALWLYHKALLPAFHGIRTAFFAVGDAAAWLWDKGVKPAFHGLTTGVHAVGGAASWLWNKAIKPAFDGITSAGSWLWTKGLKPAFHGITVGVSAVGDAAVWLWNKALNPAFTAIASAAGWLYHEIIKPIVNDWVAAFRVLGDIASWLYHKIIHPVFTVIGVLVKIVWNILKGIFILWDASWRLVGFGMAMVYEKLIKPTLHGVASLIGWLWKDVAKPIFHFIAFAWHEVGVGIEWAHVHLITPAIHGVASLMRWLWKNVAEGTFHLISKGWKLLGEGIERVRARVILPAIHGVASLVGWLWKTVAKPTFAFIAFAWHELGVGVEWVHAHIIKPALHGIASLIQWLWANVAKPTFHLISSGWKLVGDGVQWVHAHIITPAIHGVASLIGWLWAKGVKPVLHLLRTGWHDMGLGFKATYDRVLHPVIKGFGDTLSSVWLKGIKPVLGHIGDAFRALKKHIADPINFVITTIYDGGIRPFFNAIAAATQQSTRLDYIAPIKGFHDGGYTGKAPERQPVGFVHGDEHVTKASSRRKIESRHPGFLDYLNDHGHLPGYARGGTVDNRGGGIINFEGGRFTPTFAAHLKLAQQAAGYMFRVIQGGWRPATSYSGTSHRGDAVDVSPVNGTTVKALRANGIAAWDRTGMGNWSPHVHGVPLPGFGTPLGSAVWQGQDYLHGGNGLGGRDNGAGSGDHSSPGGILGGIGGVIGSIGGAIGKAFDFVAHPLKIVEAFIKSHMSGLPGGGLGIIGQAAKNLPGMAVGWAKRFFGSHGGVNGGIFGGSAPTGSGVNRWAPTLRTAMGMTGMPASTLDNWLRQVQTESGGNPRAVQGNIGDVNNRSGDLAKGLLQVIGSTFAQYRNPSLPNDRFNGLANSYAGMNYAKHRYGLSHIEGVIGHGHGYASGTQSALPGWARVGENGPEMVKFRGGEQVMNAPHTRAAAFRTVGQLNSWHGTKGPVIEFSGDIRTVDVEEFTRKATTKLRDFVSMSGLNSVGV